MLLVGQRFLMLCSNNRERGPPDQICSDYTHNSILNNMSFSSRFKIQPPSILFCCVGAPLFGPPPMSQRRRRAALKSLFLLLSSRNSSSPEPWINRVWAALRTHTRYQQLSSPSTLFFFFLFLFSVFTVAAIWCEVTWPWTWPDPWKPALMPRTSTKQKATLNTGQRGSIRDSITSVWFWTVSKS